MISIINIQILVCLSNELNKTYEYSVFNEVETEDYFDQDEQSGQYSYTSSEEE